MKYVGTKYHMTHKADLWKSRNKLKVKHAQPLTALYHNSNINYHKAIVIYIMQIIPKGAEAIITYSYHFGAA